jgi:hypothetical protein
MQYDDPAWQCLPESHSPEQQSALESQSLPAVLQLSLSATQVLSAPQSPLQQASLLVQALPSDTHWSEAHLPPLQLSEQQSVPTAQESPELAQLVVLETQPVFGSQSPEQHSVPPTQASPTAWHAPVEPLCP